MTEERVERIDLWAERCVDLAALLDQLDGQDAMDVLRAVVRDCPIGEHVGPVLAGAIAGQAARRRDRGKRHER